MSAGKGQEGPGPPPRLLEAIVHSTRRGGRPGPLRRGLHSVAWVRHPPAPCSAEQLLLPGGSGSGGLWHAFGSSLLCPLSVPPPRTRSARRQPSAPLGGSANAGVHAVKEGWDTMEAEAAARDALMAWAQSTLLQAFKVVRMTV